MLSFDIVQVVPAVAGGPVNFDIAAIDAAIGILVAPVVGLITGENTPPEIKSALAILLSVVIGFVHVWLAGQWNPNQVAASIGAVLIASGIAHATVFGPIDRKLQKTGLKIGDKTNG